MNRLLMKEQLQRFLIEDIGEGDVTSRVVISKDMTGRGKIIAKEDGVMAGGEVLSIGYGLIDSRIDVNVLIEEGSTFRRGETIALIEGPTVHLLAGERVLLNILQRMSGIATMTAKAIAELNDDTIRICDTRKTTPGLRQFEKYAVRCGGGYNHRLGLSEAVLLKENHVLACGGIKKAVQAVHEQIGHMVKVEVETTNETEVLEAIESEVDVIMFDNASPEDISKFVRLVPKGVKTEASGGIKLENLAAFRGCGVDYISLGFLTHSVKATDLSFLFAEGNE